MIALDKMRKGARGFDLIVATPSDLERHQDDVGLIYGTAIREGRTIYAA